MTAIYTLLYLSRFFKSANVTEALGFRQQHRHDLNQLHCHLQSHYLDYSRPIIKIIGIRSPDPLVNTAVLLCNNRIIGYVIKSNHITHFRQHGPYKRIKERIRGTNRSTPRRNAFSKIKKIKKTAKNSSNTRVMFTWRTSYFKNGSETSCRDASRVPVEHGRCNYSASSFRAGTTAISRFSCL